MISCTVIFAALLLDQLFGEPRRFHPLVRFGLIANWFERKYNTQDTPLKSVSAGLVSMLTLVLPVVAIVVIITQLLGRFYPIVDLLVLYLAVGAKSLAQHVQPIQSFLQLGNIAAARVALSQVVSRDTGQLNETQIAAASVETTLENGCDALFGALFWYLVGGAPLVVAYRLCNTLDAMWGYRTERFEWFGKSAAKLDDAFNFIPARLTAISYAICGNVRKAANSWRNYASELRSPNAGPVMTAGAGSLNLKLGGDAYYHGQLTQKVNFGGQNLPQASDIKRATNLVMSATVVWLTSIFLTTLVIALLN